MYESWNQSVWLKPEFSRITSRHDGCASVSGRPAIVMQAAFTKRCWRLLGSAVVDVSKQIV
jgi:hypothetical protein